MTGLRTWLCCLQQCAACSSVPPAAVCRLQQCAACSIVLPVACSPSPRWPTRPLAGAATAAAVAGGADRSGHQQRLRDSRHPDAAAAALISRAGRRRLDCSDRPTGRPADRTPGAPGGAGGERRPRSAGQPPTGSMTILVLFPSITSSQLPISRPNWVCVQSVACYQSPPAPAGVRQRRDGGGASRDQVEKARTLPCSQIGASHCIAPRSLHRHSRSPKW